MPFQRWLFLCLQTIYDSRYVILFTGIVVSRNESLSPITTNHLQKVDLYVCMLLWISDY